MTERPLPEKVAREYDKVYFEGYHLPIVLSKLLFRLLTFPIWLPLFIRTRRKLRQEMVTFTEALAREGVTDHRQIALKWVGGHPKEHVSVSHIERLEKTFQEILSKRKLYIYREYTSTNLK